MALILCQNASFAYEGNVVVHQLNFWVESGDYLCIVGENGSGKTTLMKGLLGLKRPYEGIITTGDGLRPDEIGYLPQQTPAQKDFPASVYEVVLSGRLSSQGLLPFYTLADRRIAMEHMRRLGIANLKHKCYRDLSGGQQQRVLLCRALCATQKLLLLDEPVTGLDPMATQELYGLIQQSNRETGLTVVMISHDIHSAVRYASHILHLENQQAFFGATGQYVQSPFGARFLGEEEGR